MILYKMLLLFMWNVLKNSKKLCDKWNCLTESIPWNLTRNWFFLKLNWKLLKATVTFRLSDKQFKGSKIKNYLLSWGVNPPSLIYLEKLYYYFSFLLRIMFEKCLSFFIWLRNFWQAWVFCRLSCVTVLSIIFISLPLFGDVSGGPDSKGSPLLGASTLHLEEKDKIDLKSPRQQLLFQLFLAEKAKVPITIQDFPFEYYPSAGELLALPKGTKIAGSVLDDQFNWLLGFQQKYLRETLEDSNLYRAAYYRKLDRDYIKQYKNLRNISKIPNSSVKKPSLFYYIFDHMNFQGGMDTILKQYISNALINKAIRAKASVVEDSRACYTSLPVKKVPPKFINPVFSTFASDFPMLNSDFYRNPGRIHKSSASGFSATNIWTPFNIYPRADFTHAGFAGRYAFMYPYWPMTSKYDLPKWPFTHEESWLRHSVNQRLLFDEPDAYRAWGEQYVCDQANLWGQKELKEERLFYAFYSRRKPLPKPYFNPLQQIRSVVQKGDNFSGNAGRFSPAANLSDEIFQAWKQKYSGFSLSKPSPESRVEEQWYQAKLFAFDKKYKMAQNLRNFQDSLFSFNNIRLFLNREQMLYLRNHLEFMPQRLQVAPLPVMDAVRFSDLSRKQSRNRWDLVRNWQAYLENELPANRKDSQANLNFNFQSIIDRYKQPFLYVFDLYKSSEERNRWKNMFEFHLRYHLLKQDKVVPTIKYVATSCWSLRPYFNLLTWNGFRYGTSFLNWFESVIGPKTWGIDEAAIIFFWFIVVFSFEFLRHEFFWRVAYRYPMLSTYVSLRRKNVGYYFPYYWFLSFCMPILFLSFLEFPYHWEMQDAFADTLAMQFFNTGSDIVVNTYLVPSFLEKLSSLQAEARWSYYKLRHTLGHLTVFEYILDNIPVWCSNFLYAVPGVFMTPKTKESVEKYVMSKTNAVTAFRDRSILAVKTGISYLPLSVTFVYETRVMQPARNLEKYLKKSIASFILHTDPNRYSFTYFFHFLFSFLKVRFLSKIYLFFSSKNAEENSAGYGRYGKIVALKHNPFIVKHVLSSIDGFFEEVDRLHIWPNAFFSDEKVSLISLVKKLFYFIKNKIIYEKDFWKTGQAFDDVVASQQKPVDPLEIQIEDRYARAQASGRDDWHRIYMDGLIQGRAAGVKIPLSAYFYSPRMLDGNFWLDDVFFPVANFYNENPTPASPRSMTYEHFLQSQDSYMEDLFMDADWFDTSALQYEKDCEVDDELDRILSFDDDTHEYYDAADSSAEALTRWRQIYYDEFLNVERPLLPSESDIFYEPKPLFHSLRDPLDRFYIQRWKEVYSPEKFAAERSMYYLRDSFMQQLAKSENVSPIFGFNEATKYLSLSPKAHFLAANTLANAYFNHLTLPRRSATQAQELKMWDSTFNTHFIPNLSTLDALHYRRFFAGQNVALTRLPDDASWNFEFTLAWQVRYMEMLTSLYGLNIANTIFKFPRLSLFHYRDLIWTYANKDRWYFSPLYMRHSWGNLPGDLNWSLNRFMLFDHFSDNSVFSPQWQKWVRYFSLLGMQEMKIYPNTSKVYNIAPYVWQFEKGFPSEVSSLLPNTHGAEYIASQRLERAKAKKQPRFIEQFPSVLPILNPPDWAATFSTKQRLSLTPEAYMVATRLRPFSSPMLWHDWVKANYPDTREDVLAPVESINEDFDYNQFIFNLDPAFYINDQHYAYIRSRVGSGFMSIKR